MGNVSDAMKKHQAEEGTKPPAERRTAAPPVPAAAGKPAGQPRHKRVKLNGYAPELVAHHDRGSSITEEYRGLRNKLLAKYDNERFCLLVTSAERGEGKTLTCMNLSIVLAERPEFRTVVVDCDLRGGKVAQLTRLDPSPGVADVLRGTASLDDVIRPTPYPNLFVIPAGKVEEDEIGELLGRPELDEIVGRLRRDYDHVLIDAPPVSVGSDAEIVGRIIGEALLVVRMYRTKRDRVEQAIRELHGVNVKPVGLVLTHEKEGKPGGRYYRYRYNYY